MSDKIIIFVTAATTDEAAKIGKLLVENRLAACCSIVPGIQSIYWWDNRIVEDAEALLIIKSIKLAEQKIIEIVKANHSYEVPEIISIPLTGGFNKYFEWIERNVIIS